MLRAAALIPALFLAACAAGPGGGTAGAPPPGFSADTFTVAGLMSGATATEAGCRALPDGLWVTDGRGRFECLRYALGGPPGRGRTAVVAIHGDPADARYRSDGGALRVERVSGQYAQGSPATLAASGVAMGHILQQPVARLMRPGMYGSSGNHAQDRYLRSEVDMINDAISQLKSREGWRAVALAGLSSGGAVAAELLTRREDIVCAALASAPLDANGWFARFGSDWQRNAFLARDTFDPLRSIGEIRSRRAAVFVIGDAGDQLVSWDVQRAWAPPAQAAGIRVELLQLPAMEGDATRHNLFPYAQAAAAACAAGMAPDAVAAALRNGTLPPPPPGRRLTGPEIAAAHRGLAAHGANMRAATPFRLRYTEDGRVLRVEDHSRPELAVQTDTWRVEGDRICFGNGPCREVYADGPYLHQAVGSPPRIWLTALRE